MDTEQQTSTQAQFKARTLPRRKEDDGCPNNRRLCVAVICAVIAAVHALTHHLHWKGYYHLGV